MARIFHRQVFSPRFGGSNERVDDPKLLGALFFLRPTSGQFAAQLPDLLNGLGFGSRSCNND